MPDFLDNLGEPAKPLSIEDMKALGRLLSDNEPQPKVYLITPEIEAATGLPCGSVQPVALVHRRLILDMEKYA